MMFGKLGVLNAFSTYDIFNSKWVYQEVTQILNMGIGRSVPSIYKEFSETSAPGMQPKTGELLFYS